ncbi:MAG: amidohydrolase family protein, partial [Gammaproteobacteria bacterium]
AAVRALSGFAAMLLLAIGEAHAAGAVPKPAPVVIVWAGTLLAVPGRAPATDQSIVIRGGLIERVAPGRLTAASIGAEPSAARTVDLSKFYVLPGLFDLHVHLTTEPDPAASMDEVTLTSADLALRAASNAEKTLNAGFTTVLDMGTGRRTHELAIYAVRDAIASGQMQGPRILAVGSPISPPGNSRTTRYAPDVERAVGPQGVCSGAEDCRRAVREQIQRGADAINFYNTGSLLSPSSPAQTFADDEMLAIVETAHSLNRKAVADGAGKKSSASGVNAAIRAGADWVDTVIYPAKDTWSLLAKSGHYYAPHLYAVVAAVGDDEAHLSDGSMGWLPPPVLEELLALKRQTPAAVAAHAAGIRMVFASDAGVFAHGRNAGEFEQYVKAGLTPAQAIATATVNAAEVLGLSADSGTLEPGKRADLIAVSGDPLTDVSLLRNVRVVIRGGDVVKQ